ncbi:MAG: hypothetical protein ACK4MT_10505 [Thermaurantiacus tibetensis]|uniref:hypothetical protein n=1 Tax=Thermaurantiacus tibetensis TaxID=2759035 RepID=UPI0018903CBD|nr:hypothetical protein [Thermaurantiacus tibetensis]
MDLNSLIAKISAETGETVEAVQARLSEASGVTAEKLAEIREAIRARTAEGTADARALIAEVAAKVDVGADKVTALFEQLKSEVEGKGLSGLWAEWTAALDKDGDGSILDDLKDRIAGLFGRRDG